MSCLSSKHELLQVADHIIAHYYQRVPFVRNHPQAIDLDMLVMELMGGSIKMFPLSKDGSMLGMTAHERLIIRMELEDGTIICDTLRPKDIVIDSSLAGFHNTGVRNFTLAHEIGHADLNLVTMYAYEGYTVTEISKVLGVAQPTISIKIKRITKFLKNFNFNAMD